MKMCTLPRLLLLTLAALLVASLVTVRFHDALIDARREGLLGQAEAIAALLAAASALEPEHMAPMLRRLVPGPGTRARVLAPEGVLLVDTRHRVGRDSPSNGIWTEAVNGHAATARLMVEDGQLIASVAVPIRRGGVVHAVLLLSTPAAE